MSGVTSIPAIREDTVSLSAPTTKFEGNKNSDGRYKRLSTSSIPSAGRAVAIPSGRAQPGHVRSRSITIDHSAKKRADLFARSVPHDKSFDKQVSDMGWAATSERSAASTAFRGVFNATIPAGSPNYVGLPNAALGITTVEGIYKGPYKFYGAVQAGRTYWQIGDKTGMGLTAIDFLSSATQTILGFSNGVLRAKAIGSGVGSGIGSVIVPSSSPLANVTPAFAETAGVLSTVFDGIDAIGETIQLKSSSNFIEKYQAKKKIGEGAAYLRSRLGVDVEALREKALNGKTSEDFQKEGLKHLRPFAKRNIALLQKHGKLPPVEIEAEHVDRYIYKFLGKGKESEGRKVVEHVGQNVLIERLKAKKWTKMERILGKKAFKEVVTELQKPNPDTIVKAKRQKIELDKIVLGEITLAQSNRKKKIALYVAGAATAAILSFVTGGGWIAGLLLAAAIVYAIIALGKFYLAYKDAEEQTKIVDVAPGRYDWLIASAPGLLIGAGTLVLLGFVSMGTIPLAIGILGAILLLARSVHNAYVIHERRQNYCQHLMNKQGAITLDEFAYLAEYMPEDKLINDSPIRKLPKEERKAINRLLEDAAYGQDHRQRLLEAIKRRREQQEEALASRLWGKTEGRPSWIVPGMIPMMHPPKKLLSPKTAELA